MRSLHHVIILLLAVGGAGCTSGGAGVDQDADIADTGVTSGVPVLLDGNSSVINLPGCAPSEVMTNCQDTDTHYAFNGNQGKCLPVQGCDAVATLFDTLMSCEVECARFLRCSINSASGAVDGGAGACGTCPVMSMDSFLPNSKATVMSGQNCTYSGLTCYMSSGTSPVSWVCSCGADGNWSCVPPPSGCQLC